MAPCLSKLPSVCLETIFKYMPLVDLYYTVGLVCTSWHNSRRTELMRRRRLRLVLSDARLEYHRVHECFYGTELIERVRRDDGSPWYTLESLEQFKFNCLSVPDGKLKTVAFFSSLMNMSSITCLHLKLFRIKSDVKQVIRLVDHWSEQLVDLKLEFSFFYELYDKDTSEHALKVTSLIDCLNRLRSLRHLNLSLSAMSSTHPPPHLSCLSHLTTFSIHAGCHSLFGSVDGWICASIKQYGQNVTSIQINNTMDIRTMLQIDAQLATKFNVLYVRHDFDNNEDDIDVMQTMSLFCTRFSSLTKLKLGSFISSLPMTKLARCLSSLTQLVHLDLKIFQPLPVEGVQPQDELQDENGEIGDHAQQRITQVPSVRLLAIHLMYNFSHLDSERLFIAEIFPNLQVLRFKHTFNMCRDCELDLESLFDDSVDLLDVERNFNPELARRVAECKRLTRQPFRRCANLHTVALVASIKETLINLDDL